MGGAQAIHNRHMMPARWDLSADAGQDRTSLHSLTMAS